MIAKQGLAEAKKKKIDVVIMDTAGRLQVIYIYIYVYLFELHGFFLLGIRNKKFTSVITDRQEYDGGVERR